MILGSNSEWDWLCQFDKRFASKFGLLILTAASGLNELAWLLTNNFTKLGTAKKHYHYWMYVIKFVIQFSLHYNASTGTSSHCQWVMYVAECMLQTV